jgi:choline dehydrogenase-like flavoprotein
MAQRAIVIIGAGVVGAALADELTMRGERDVTVVDKGPLFATGGSSTHAPGLVSRTSPSKFMQETADHTISRFAASSTPQEPALVPVGPSVERSIAYAWVPVELEAGASVDLAYFERTLPAVVTDEPLFDPAGARPRA